MSARLMTTYALKEALEAEGFPLPADCGEVRLVLGVHKAMMLEYDVFVSGENLARLGRALLRIAEPEPK